MGHKSMVGIAYHLNSCVTLSIDHISVGAWADSAVSIFMVFVTHCGIDYNLSLVRIRAQTVPADLKI